jgi:hypothetical protein
MDKLLPELYGYSSAIVLDCKLHCWALILATSWVSGDVEMLICYGRVQLPVSDIHEKLAWREATAWQQSLPPAHNLRRTVNLGRDRSHTCQPANPPPPLPSPSPGQISGTVPRPQFFTPLSSLPTKTTGINQTRCFWPRILVLTLIHLQWSPHYLPSASSSS